MSLLENFLKPLYISLHLESDTTMKSYITAGVLGTTLHVLLDTPLYYDIKPFYPVMINPNLLSNFITIT